MARCFLSGKYVSRARYSAFGLTGAIFFHGISMTNPSPAAGRLALFFSEQRAQLVGHFRNIFLTKLHGFAIALDNVVLCSPGWVQLLKIDRLWAPRLSSRASALKATASETVSIDFKSSARCHPGL